MALEVGVKILVSVSATLTVPAGVIVVKLLLDVVLFANGGPEVGADSFEIELPVLKEIEPVAVGV